MEQAEAFTWVGWCLLGCFCLPGAVDAAGFCANGRPPAALELPPVAATAGCGRDLGLFPATTAAAAPGAVVAPDVDVLVLLGCMLAPLPPTAVLMLEVVAVLMVVRFLYAAPRGLSCTVINLA